MTNSVESTQRPSRKAIALESALVGIGAGFLIYLVVSLPGEPRWYDWLGMVAWTGLIGIYAWTLVRMIRRRWAPQEPTGYIDRDGDQWTVLEDGNLTFDPDVPGLPLEAVEQDYGPLTPIYG